MRSYPLLGHYGRFIASAAIACIAAGPTFGEVAPKAADEVAKSSERLDTMRSRPKAYGTEDYTVTFVPAVAFLPETSDQAYYTSGSLGRFGPLNTVQNFYAAIDLPYGAIVDYVGLNSSNDAPFALGVTLYHRYYNGSAVPVADFSSTIHDWGMDYNVDPIGYQSEIPGADLIRVQQGNHSTYQFFGHVEVWWRRNVRPEFGVTFNDVPIDHPFHQFIEALAASGITGGCGNGNFCPGNPVTRGQMAVFLAKALGLNWAVAGPPPGGPGLH